MCFYVNVLNITLKMCKCFLSDDVLFILLVFTGTFCLLFITTRFLGFIKLPCFWHLTVIIYT